MVEETSKGVGTSVDIVRVILLCAEHEEADLFENKGPLLAPVAKAV